jgi:hypothetical protein
MRCTKGTVLPRAGQPLAADLPLANTSLPRTALQLCPAQLSSGLQQHRALQGQSSSVAWCTASHPHQCSEETVTRHLLLCAAATAAAAAAALSVRALAITCSALLPRCCPQPCTDALLLAVRASSHAASLHTGTPPAEDQH